MYKLNAVYVHRFLTSLLLLFLPSSDKAIDFVLNLSSLLESSTTIGPLQGRLAVSKIKVKKRKEKKVRRTDTKLNEPSDVSPRVPKSTKRVIVKNLKASSRMVLFADARKEFDTRFASRVYSLQHRCLKNVKRDLCILVSPRAPPDK